MHLKEFVQNHSEQLLCVGRIYLVHRELSHDSGVRDAIELNDDYNLGEVDVMRLERPYSRAIWLSLLDKITHSSSRAMTTNLSIIILFFSNTVLAQQRVVVSENSVNEYHDQWFDRTQEFHDGGQMADEILRVKKELEEFGTLYGPDHPKSIAAAKKLQELESERLSSMKELRELTRYGVRYYERNKIRDAVVYARMALKVRRKIYGASDFTVGIAASEAARMELRKGDTFGFIEKHLRESRSIFLKQLGADHWRVRDMQVALDDLTHLRSTLPRVQSRFIQCRARAARCRDLINQGNFFEAIDIARKERDFLRMYAVDRPLTALVETLMNMARAYEALGHYTESIPLQQQALEMGSQIYGENHPKTVTTLNALYSSYRKIGDQSRALSTAREALRVCNEVWGKERIEYAVCQTNLAEALIPAASYDEARPMLVEALQFAERDFRNHSTEWTHSLHHLAEVEFRTGRLEEAKRLFGHVLKNRASLPGKLHPDYLATLTRLGEVNSRLKNYTEARTQLDDALKLAAKVIGAKHPDFARTQAQLAAVHRAMGDHTSAEDILDKALSVMRHSLDTTFSVLSERQQMVMTINGYQMLSDYISLAVQTNQPVEKIYAHVLNWKGAVINQRVQTRAVATDSESRPLFEQLQEVSRKLASLALSVPKAEHRESVRGLVRKLSGEKERLESELAQLGSGAPSAQNNVSPQEVRASLPQNTVLVDFYVYEGKQNESVEKRLSQRMLLAFVVRSESELAMVELGSMAPIRKSGEKWRREIMQGGGTVRGIRLLAGKAKRGTFPQYELRRLLWEPVEKLLKEKETVLVSPDGPIASFPLPALPGRRAGEYLIQERTLVVVPVPKQLPDLLMTESQFENDSSLLLVGEVDFDAPTGRTTIPDPALALVQRSATRSGTTHFAPLPGTRREMTSIARLHRQKFSDSALVELNGAAATESRFRRTAQESQVLHLATHGFFTPPSVVGERTDKSDDSLLHSFRFEHPGLTVGLALAGANRKTDASDGSSVTDDGIFTALEVTALNLTRANLVVLSACETGLGLQSSGEGLLSLQRAFQVAGARSTVTSMWKVDDAGTEALMVEFYKNLWQERMGKIQALRSAQLAMFERYDPNVQRIRPRGSKPDPSQRTSPYYWAAFVLSGDWR